MDGVDDGDGKDDDADDGDNGKFVMMMVAIMVTVELVTVVL